VLVLVRVRVQAEGAEVSDGVAVKAVSASCVLGPGCAGLVWVTREVSLPNMLVPRLVAGGFIEVGSKFALERRRHKHGTRPLRMPTVNAFISPFSILLPYHEFSGVVPIGQVFFVHHQWKSKHPESPAHREDARTTNLQRAD